MTNKEIIDHVSTKGKIVFYGAHTAEMYELLELARADEREKLSNTTEQTAAKLSGEELDKYLDGKRELFKLNGSFSDITLDDIRGREHQPQGVEVWASWDSSPTGYATIQSEKPFERKIVGGTSYGIRGGHCTKLTDGFAKYLGIKQGECKKLRIVEVEG